MEKYFEDHSGISLFVENMIMHHTPEYQMAHSEELMQRIFSSKLCLALSHQQSLLTKCCVLGPAADVFYIHEAKHFSHMRHLFTSVP